MQCRAFVCLGKAGKAKKKASRFRLASLSGGATQIWTGEWSFCRALPYHLAIAPLLSFWSGRRDSNSRHLPWQGNALPLSHSRTYTILSFGAGDEIYELKGSYKLAYISELCERPFSLARGASYHWVTPAQPLFMSITSYQNIICLIIDVMLTGYPLNNGIFGGNNRVRTYDPLLVRQVLSQLSYASASAFIIYQILFVL